MSAQNISDTQLSPSAEHMNDPVPNKKSGHKDQAVTKPITLDAVSGEVVVRKATGKVKIRKGQSNEEYQQQLYNYFEECKGPVRTEEAWMDSEDIKLDSYDCSVKQERQTLLAVCQRMYFKGQFQDCHDLAQQLLERFELLNLTKSASREKDELRYLVECCAKRVSEPHSGANIENK